MLTSIKRLAALLALAIMAFTSCDKDGFLIVNILSGNKDKTSGEQQKEAGLFPEGGTSLPASAGGMWVEVSASGSWVLILEFPEGVSAWAKLTPSEGVDDASNIRFTYESNPTENQRSVNLCLLTGDGEKISLKMTQDSGSGQGGSGSDEPEKGQYGYDYAPAALNWLELPAMTANDGRELLIHNFDGGRYVNRKVSGVRNWSCYWDFEEHMSLWVAYPLNNSLKGSGSRSNSWGYDALLPAGIQPDITNTYGGGWTRGHQIPSADRLTTEAANASTFVSTNMTPQDYNFNSEIWADLEGKVRSYANLADTLYVVTGALFDNSTMRSGSNTGFSIKIPTHYFKALLYKGSSTYATKGYMAAGFFLPHDTGISRNNFLNYIMSIDQLEEKTGIDFFPNLIGVLGKDTADSIEAQTPGTWWK